VKSGGVDSSPNPTLTNLLNSMLIKTRCQEQPMPLNESWSSFYQQQQQQPPAAPPQNQNPPANQDPPATDPNAPVDPFKDINTENMDDASKAAVEKARVEFANAQKTAAEAKAEAEKIKGVASKYQSAADQYRNRLAQHNLLDDPQGRGGGARTQTPEQQQEEQLVQAYMQKGMAEPAAKQLAATMMVGLGVLKPGILNEVGSFLGPQIGKLNGLAAQRYVDEFASSGESALALKIPGVREAAMAIVDTMMQNRQDVTRPGVDAAIKMAMGEVMMKGGPELTKLLTGNGNGHTTPPPPTQQPTWLQSIFGGASGGSGGFALPPNAGRTNGAPTPVNEDTARAAANLAAAMDRQIKK
jgi:hypothetical protein